MGHPVVEGSVIVVALDLSEKAKRFAVVLARIEHHQRDLAHPGVEVVEQVVRPE